MYSAEDLFTEEAEDDLERIVEGNYEDQAIEEDGDGNEANVDNENDQGGGDNDDGNQAADGAQAAVKTKRVVRNPQPKFNADTLRKPRGLLCLQSLFDRVQFKGRGYEEQDLNMLMKTYEYWCHRMFPKFPFDDSIARLEKLGTKKEVQVYLKRIRLDMLTDSDDRPELISDQPEDEVDNDDDPFDSLLPQTESNAQSVEAEAWTDDQLRRLEENRRKAEVIKLEKLRKIQEKATAVLERSQVSQTVDQATSSADRRHEFPDELDEIDARANYRDDFPMEEELANTEETGAALQWSNEQLQRLEENRKRAERIRLERQRKTEEMACEDKQDAETINPSASQDTNACSGELCETNNGVVAHSETSLSSPVAQEHNVEFTSVDTDDVTATSREVCSQEILNDNTEIIAQDIVDLPKVSEEMEVDEATLPNNEETLPVHLVDSKPGCPNVEDNFAINVSQSETAKVDNTVIANKDNISNQNQEEKSGKSTEICTNEMET